MSLRTALHRGLSLLVVFSLLLTLLPAPALAQEPGVDPAPDERQRSTSYLPLVGGSAAAPPPAAPPAPQPEQPAPVPFSDDGKWPVQLAGATGAMRPSLHGPQRNDPAEGIPVHAYSPFDERNNREYPCPPSGCNVMPGQLLLKLAPGVPTQRTGGALRTTDAELNTTLDELGIVTLTPVFPTAKAPRAGELVEDMDGNVMPKPDLTRWVLATAADPDTDLAAAVTTLRTSARVTWVEPVYLRKPVGEMPNAERGMGNAQSEPRPSGRADGVPTEKSEPRPSGRAATAPAAALTFNDPLYAQQWHLGATNVPQAWQWLADNSLSPGGNRDIVVAVIDTGVDYTHPDLAANIWTNSREIAGNGIDDDSNGFVDDLHGADTVTGDGDPLDDHGHGTHVTGIIAAQANNGIGGVGVAYNVQVMPIKAAQYSGVLASSDIAEAIYYAVTQGADVINMSFGGYARSQIEEDALATAFGQAVLVAAAGNDGKVNVPCPYGRDMYPAAYNWVLGVMARTPTPDAQGDYLAGFSNFDCRLQDSHEYELMAPGVEIWSTLPNGQQAAWAGTSMATPVVTGIAALARTKWADKDVYSSRFIMGQIATTGGMMQAYTPPQGDPVSYYTPNAFLALTTVPQPKLSYLEHWTFDTTAQAAGNDGDGIVDAGETVDLAITIRNHWGKADNVQVTLAAQAGVVGTDPYVTMNIGTVNYGAVGSFNIDDNGLIYDDQGAITGVRNPFRFTVDPNTPNDHVIPFKLTMVANNGYDPSATPLVFTSSFNLLVQRGRELPRIINQDMTLTKDSLWLVSDASLIEAGVTVTVTEGTQVQFWSTDPNDPYSQNARPRLQVEGNLRAIGTVEAPVEFFSGAMYPGYAVRIERANSGAVELNYVRLLNPRVNAASIRHSYFAQELFDYIRDRSEYGLTTVPPEVYGDTIADSVFYKLGSEWGGRFSVYNGTGNLHDSNDMQLSGQTIQDSIFLKNYKLYETQWGDRQYWVSRSDGTGYGMYKPTFLRTAFPAQYNGKTYVALAKPYGVDVYTYLDVAEEFANLLGGHVVSINDAAENQFLVSYRNNNFTQTNFDLTYPTMNCGSPSQGGPWNGCWVLFEGYPVIGLTDREIEGQFGWISSEPASYFNWMPGEPDSRDYQSGAAVNADFVRLAGDQWVDSSDFGGPVILELPGALTQARLDEVTTQIASDYPRVVRAHQELVDQGAAIRAADTAPFLDLPFAYTNFAEAALGNVNGQSAGRVLAWFDHSSPDNTADGNLVLWSGAYSTSVAANIARDGCTTGLSCFDGHNGIDFSPVMVGEPIYAAANGRVVAVTSGGRYGNQIWIDHGNGYATLYGHLASTGVITGATISDRLAQALGAMGSSGDAIGTQLHFGVYFDQNGDDAWSEDEAVDPYGWIDEGNDPLTMPNFYLWLHPLKTTGTVDPISGVNTTLVSPSGHITVTLPYHAFTSTTEIELWETSPVVDIARNDYWGSNSRSIGRSFSLFRVNSSVSLQTSYQLHVTYQPTDTLHLAEGSVILSGLDEANRSWQSVAGDGDPNQDRFSTTVNRLGRFDLQTYKTCWGDPSEINDNHQSAHSIATDNALYPNSLDLQTDQDWFRFQATAGERYLISTADLGFGVNTYLELFGRDGFTRLAADDNGGGGYASRIEWQAPTDGVYFIRVTPVASSTTDCSATYSVRVNWRAEQFEAQLEAVRQHMIAVGPSLGFKNNAILNVWWDPNINHWMRFFMNDARDWVRYLNGNWFGTTSTTLIDAAIQDYNDDFNKGLYVYQPILTEPPTTTYPFVTDVTLSTAGLTRVSALNGPTPIVGAEPVTFTVTFNRDMDPSVQPAVSFGPDVPETDYTIHAINGGWSDARTWQGVVNITPVTGDGYQFMRIIGARAADDPWLVTGDDSERFRFEIITSGTESMNLQANGGEGFVDLSWTQDDFDLLAGFNLYRAITQDGEYTRINPSILPPQERSFRDTDVVPGQPYYYKFTVVKSDMTESDFSNVATATPLDTIAPVISHTPVLQAAPGQALTLAADVTDNVSVQSVTLFHRKTGTTAYSSRAMVKTTGDRYSATLEGSLLVAPGLDYYIEATDGVSPVRHGRPEAPNQVLVQDRPTVTAVAPVRGPAGGGTRVTISGSNFKPGATVRFDNSAAMSVTVVSANQITCYTPPHFPTVADVTVVNPSSESGSLLRGFTYEADRASLSLPDTTAGQGARVPVPINLANVAGMAAADVTITFDPAVVTGVGAQTGSLTPGWTVVANTATPGQVRLSLASAGGTVSGSGVLASLEFDVAGAPGVTTTLHVASVRLNDGAIPVDAQDGAFSVDLVYYASGSVTHWNGGAVSNTQLSLAGDRLFTGASDVGGQFAVGGAPRGAYTLTPSKSDAVRGVSAYDASLALQHAAGAATLSGAAFTAADVNGSGEITAMDAFYILQKAVDLIPVPFPGAGQVWKFTPASRSYADLASNQSGQDFTAILLGDPSGNWANAATRAADAADAPLVFRVTPAVDDVVTATLWLAGDVGPVHAVDLALQGTGATVHSIDVALNPRAAGWIEAANVQADGRIHLALAGAQPVTGAGALAVLRFTLAEPSAGLQFTAVGAALDEAPAAVQVEQETPNAARSVFLPLLAR